MKNFYKIFFVPIVAIFFISLVAGFFYIKNDIYSDYHAPGPERINKIVEEIDSTLGELVGSEDGGVFEETVSLLEEANCDNTKSLCRQDEGWSFFGVFGVSKGCEPMEDLDVAGSLWDEKEKEDDFHIKQEEIKEKKNQIAFLQNILKKEMKHGIQKDLELMRTREMGDEADQAERDLGLILYLLDPNDEEAIEVLNDIDEDIVTEGESIMDDIGVDWSEESLIAILDELILISPESGKMSCAHRCHEGYYFEFCWAQTKQEDIDIIFNIALSLEDLEIDPIRIEEVELSLVEEITLPEVKIDFEIPIPDLKIDFPRFSSEKMTEEGFQVIDDTPTEVSSPSFRNIYSDAIWLSCPDYTTYSYGPEGPVTPGEVTPTEMEWYFSTYEYLSKGCNSLWKTRQYPIHPECYDISQLISATSSRCSNAWNCIPKTGECSCLIPNCSFCTDLYCYCGGTLCATCSTGDAQEKACVNLYTDQGEPVPQACIKPDPDLGDSWTYDPLGEIETKCFEILEEQKEAGTLGSSSTPSDSIPAEELFEDYLEVVWSDVEDILISEYGVSEDTYIPTPSEENVNDAKEVVEDVDWTNVQGEDSCCEGGICGTGDTDTEKFCQAANILLADFTGGGTSEVETEMPYECALLAFWKGKVDLYAEGYEDVMEGGFTTLEEGKIGVLPDGFIGCDPPEIPTLPKIPLSDFSVEIPDIITPGLDLCPLVKADLPNVIIEDLEFEDIELCNLQDCQDLLDMFPDFIENLPTLGRFFIPIPEIEVDPITLDPIEVDLGAEGVITVPLPDIQIDPIEHPSLAFHMPQMANINPMNISNFIYEIPDIEIPSPELSFSFEGFSVDVMSLVIGLLLNMIELPFPAGCIAGGVTIGCLTFSFEDYHISWADFPKIPEIPACATVRGFCRDVEGNLEELVEETKKISEAIHNTAQDALYIPSEKFEEIEEIINEKVADAEEDINSIIQSQTFTGTVEAGIVRIDPIEISLGDIDIDISISDVADIPETVEIPWDDLGIEPTLTLTDPIEFEMPTIPLSDLSISRSLIINFPFTQVTDLFSLGVGGTECEGDTDGSLVFEYFSDNNLDTKFYEQVQKIGEIIGN